LLIGVDLYSGFLVMTSLFKLDPINPGCNALLGARDCDYTQPLGITIPNINYKIYLSITGVGL